MSGRSARTEASTSGPHHRRAEPDDHLCSCGGLRDTCVRSAVRTLWADPAAGAQDTGARAARTRSRTAPSSAVTPPTAAAARPTASSTVAR